MNAPLLAPPRVPTILVVDDHRDTLALLTSMLTRRGWEVLVAEDAREAMLLAEAHPFDVLLADLALPDRSGAELMVELKKRGPVRGIAISGYGRDEDVAACHEAGFEEHMVKPLDFGRLEAAIRRLLERP